MRPALIFPFVLLPLLVLAQTAPSPDLTPHLATSALPPTNSTTAALQASVDRLSQTNAELLDLLKKQQQVLEDIQVDRRLQSRQIGSLEERLQETLLQNQQLQDKIDKLSSMTNAPPLSPSAPMPPPGLTSTNQAAATPPPPPKPTSTIPAEVPLPDNVIGWHRLFTLTGTDSRTTDLFHIQGKRWRIVWHNQDKEGAAYRNTSALFLNAFPKDDTIPQKVCSKLGNGGDVTELIGPGNYYVKVEASGGTWEFAVEDFH
jgi:hypothetical protein